MHTVFITNKSPHDFSDAERYGRIVFLTTGFIRQYSTDRIQEMVLQGRVTDVGLVDSQPGDFLLISSLNILTAISSSVLAKRHGLVNYLLFKRGRYTDRTVLFRPIEERENSGTESDRIQPSGGDLPRA